MCLILLWVWNVISFFFRHLHGPNWNVIRSDDDTVAMAVAVAFHIHSDQFDLYEFEMIVWEPSLYLSFFFAHCAVYCLSKLFCVQLATEVPHYSHCADRDEKKVKNVRRDIHGEIMWHIETSKWKKKIHKTNFSELVIVRVILVILAQISGLRMG